MRYENHEKKSGTASGGIGATGLLGIAFIVLKLCGVIDWSWWWVLCPYWASLAVALVILLFVFLAQAVRLSKKKKA